MGERSSTLPYLVDGPPIRAVFKARWEDFEVEEISTREPEGRGDHLWMEVEKRGLTTGRAASDLARELGVKPSSVGFAGMKDSRAVARQWMSVEHVEPARALAVDIPRVRVLSAARHPRKLRRGWHGGNRFLIRLRPPGSDPAGPSGAADTRADTGPSGGVALAGTGDSIWASELKARIRSGLDTLARRGVPNYYGPQRFGSRGDTWRVGRALAREEWAEAASLIAGRPLAPGDARVDPAAGIHGDTGDILRARKLFDQGDYAEAAAAWPRGFGQCARLAEAMERTGGDAARALPVVGKRMLRLYASAYQSWLFNAVLAERLGLDVMDRLLPGDLAWKHDTEALFDVPDPQAEQDRIDRFEVSPTGPLVGRRMRAPTGEAAALEDRVLEAAGFRPERLDSAALRPLTGRRRPLRFRVRDCRVAAARDDAGPYVELRFELPPGCYATTVLRELGRGGIVEGRTGASG